MTNMSDFPDMEAATAQPFNARLAYIKPTPVDEARRMGILPPGIEIPDNVKLYVLHASDGRVLGFTDAWESAYGAALQALWCWRINQGEKISINQITDSFIELNKGESAEPNAANAAIYRELQGLQDEMSQALKGVFDKHRRFVLR